MFLTSKLAILLAKSITFYTFYMIQKNKKNKFEVLKIMFKNLEF